MMADAHHTDMRLEKSRKGTRRNVLKITAGKRPLREKKKDVRATYLHMTPFALKTAILRLSVSSTTHSGSRSIPGGGLQEEDDGRCLQCLRRLMD
jgi:hypothetical protein